MDDALARIIKKLYNSPAVQAQLAACLTQLHDTYCNPNRDIVLYDDVRSAVRGLVGEPIAKRIRNEIYEVQQDYSLDTEDIYEYLTQRFDFEADALALAKYLNSDPTGEGFTRPPVSTDDYFPLETNSDFKQLKPLTLVAFKTAKTTVKCRANNLPAMFGARLQMMTEQTAIGERNFWLLTLPEEPMTPQKFYQLGGALQMLAERRELTLYRL